MYTLTNKVTGFKQVGELKGDVIILADGSQIPVSFDPNKTLSSKIYDIVEGDVKEEVKEEVEEDDTEDEEE